MTGAAEFTDLAFWQAALDIAGAVLILLGAVFTLDRKSVV